MKRLVIFGAGLSGLTAARSLAGDFEVVALLSAHQLGSAPVPDGAQVQRRRYARPIAEHPVRWLEAFGRTNLVLASDAFGAAKVCGAVLSGVAAARVPAVRAEP